MNDNTTQRPDGETARIASYITHASYERIPAEVIRKTKLHILDTLGAIVRAVQIDVGKAIVEFARVQPGKEESTVVGTNLKSLCTTAGFVNGILGHADELDDVHHPSVLHQGCIIVPTALALGEREKISGKSFLNAIVVGYDINCRVATALNPILIRQNDHSVMGIPTVFGATAAASSILHLTEKPTCWSLGFAGQQASGTTAWLNEPRHMAKAVDSGVAVRSGITAALLAQLGFEGPPAIFEGPHNVFDSFSGEYNYGALTKDLGIAYDIMDTSIKKYPVGVPVQAPLEALFRLMREKKVAADDIAEITITMAERFAWLVSRRAIKNISIEYLVAAAACFGKVGLEETHSETKWKDPRVQSLKERIKIVGDPGSTRLGPATLLLTTKDGKRHSLHLEDAPMSATEVEAKFLDLTAPVLGPEQARKIVRAVDSLEETKDITALGDLLRTK